MKVKTLSVLAGLAGAAALSSSANAIYTGLTIVSTNSTVTLGTDTDGNPLPAVAVTRYRVYASFNSGNDRLLVWGGGGMNFVVPSLIQNTNNLGTGPGTGFLNHEDGGNTPQNNVFVSNWDSYFTLSVFRQNQIPFPTEGGLQTQGLPPIDGTALAITNGAMTTAPSFGTPTTQNPITFASFTGDSDGLGVLLMQLIVPQGQNVAGTIGIIVNNNAPLVGGDSIITGQTFNSVIPAPGALALLGLAGLVGSRRRRA